MSDAEAAGKTFEASLLLDEAQRAYWVALRATKSPSLAEDAVQETYASFLCRPPECEEKEHLRRCFLSAVRRQALMLLRSEKNRKKREQTFAEAALRSTDAGEAASAGDEEMARAARASLDRIPMEEREAVGLYCEQGFSLQEAAKILNTNKMTVLRRANRGLERLRRMLIAQGYAAATPLAVSSALSSLPPPPAPATMRETLHRLTADPAMAAEYAAKVSARMRSAVSAKKAVSGIAWGACILAAAASVAYVLSFGFPSFFAPPWRKGVAAHATAPELAGHGKLHRRWTFRDNPEAAKELEFVIGSWRWGRGEDGVGRIIPEGAIRSDGRVRTNAAAFLLPCEVPPRPVILAFKGLSFGHASFGGDWVEADGAVPRKFWQLSDPGFAPEREDGHGARPVPMAVRIVFIGRYGLGFLEDVCGGLTEYEKEYPTKRLGCAFVGYHIEEVELRELEPDETRKFQGILEGKLAEAQKRGLKATSVPYERFKPE